jgi:hypothetical protein
MICAFDERLLKNKVFFLPWIGGSYTKGFTGRKLLILGESHFTDWKEGKAGQVVRHVLDNKQTRDCINETINRAMAQTRVSGRISKNHYLIKVVRNGRAATKSGHRTVEHLSGND